MAKGQEQFFQNQTVNEILPCYRVIWALNYMRWLAEWDLNTYMPEGGATARGEALGQTDLLSKKLFFDEGFIALIKLAGKDSTLNDYERGIVRRLEHDLNHYQKLPEEFLAEFARTTSTAQLAWRQAKQESNFAFFSPHLTQIVDLVRQKADYLGYPNHPYDALLDEYEEGLLTSEVEEYFASLRLFLPDLLGYITRSRKFLARHPLEDEPYDPEKMRALNQKVLQILQADPLHLRLDIAPHPFTEGLGTPDDVRITSWYHKTNFARSLMATIHEYGHALYELQGDPRLNYTPLAGGTSATIHESQSRFWENMVGRSWQFIKLIYPDIVSLSPGMVLYLKEDIFRYLNLVRPGPIRTAADEVTYHAHIMIRFELEKALIEKKLAVDELPEAWAAKYEEYLGIRPKNDAEGILQDIHWSAGSFGYFPTYSLGTGLSALWRHLLQEDLGPLENLVGSPEGIQKVKGWLAEKIHQYGSTYTLNDLVRRLTGSTLTTDYLKDYLENKYRAIY